MADEADQSDKFISDTIDDAVEKSSIIAAAIPLGEPGICLACDTWFIRTVNGYCGRCRDEFRL